MTPRIKSGTPAGDAMLAIQRHARRSGSDVQEVMTLYVLEALLARLGASGRRDDFVLKGGVLLAAFSARRPTKDIDLEALRMDNDTNEVIGRLGAVAALDLGDGVVFDVSAASGATIREGADYVGVRVKFPAAIGRSRVTIGVDVNFGDPIVPAPVLVDIPPVVPDRTEPIRLLGYPLTMVFAEKILTAVERGEANTRWRDFADVYTLAGAHSVIAAQLNDSVTSVAAHRQVDITPLLPALAGMGRIAQPKWAAWRRRVGRADELPETFAEVLDAVARFADPVLAGAAEGSWDPGSRSWRSTSGGDNADAGGPPRAGAHGPDEAAAFLLGAAERAAGGRPEPDWSDTKSALEDDIASRLP